MPRVYHSPLPDVAIPECSIFTHVFSKNLDNGLPAYIDGPTGHTFSRGDVRSQSLEFAWGLRNILNQKRSISTIAIFSPNSIFWPIVLLGGIAAGLRITTINSAYTPSELRYQLEDSGAYYIFAHPVLLQTLRDALKLMDVSDAEARKRIILAAPARSAIPGWRCMDELLGKGQLEREESFDGAATHETVLLCYSSGTTSKSKGVELTHYNVISVMCMLVPVTPYLNPSAVLLSVLPYFHIYGLVLLVCNPVSRGASQVVMSHFDIDAHCSNIERYKVTISVVVPPILVVLLNSNVPEKYNLSSLKKLVSGAAPLGESLALAVHARFNKLGYNVSVFQGWGLTETSPSCTMQTEAEWRKHAGYIGKLLPNIQARLVLGDDETDAAVGEAGEIWIKGPNVMKGYLNNPEATRDAITSDGWFKSGDIAVVDKEGNFKIVDRKKELIKYKGFQVPPAELEGLLLVHPKVLDAGVIGVWSEAEATEYPRAYVVPRGGVASLKTSADREAFSREIQGWIQSRVARHKYLRGGVEPIDAIPKSAAGKILRRELKELVNKGSQANVTAKL